MGAVEEEWVLGEGGPPCGAKKGKCLQCSLGTAAPRQVGGRGEACRVELEELRLVREEPSSASRAAPDPGRPGAPERGAGGGTLDGEKTVG